MTYLKNRNFLIFIIVGIIILFALALRSNIFISHDLYFLVDQARDMLLTKNVAVDHKITLIGARTGFGGLFHGPLWIYMLVPSFLISGGDPFLTLVPIFLLVSVGTVLLGYYVGAKLYDRKTGIIMALLLSVSQPLLSSVPFSTNAQVLPFIVLVYLYSSIRFIRGSNKFLILSLFAAGLGFQFESAFAFLLIPLTISALVLRRSVPPIKTLLISAVAFILPLTSFILFDLRHNFLMTNSFIRLFSVHIKPLPGFEKYSSLNFRVIDRTEALINSLYSPLFDPNIVMKLFILALIGIGIAVFVYGRVKNKKKNQDDKEYIFLLLSPLIIFGIYIVYPLPLWPHYLLPVSIFTIFLTTVTLRHLLNYAKLSLLVYIFLAVLVFSPIKWTLEQYSNIRGIGTTDGSFKNQSEVARWVISDANNEDYGYFEYSPGILTYNMDYLMWWISKNYNKPTPESIKKNNTYLIMYPPASGDKGAQDFWKKNVIRTNGKILERKVFPSGITVEKLSIEDTEEGVDPNYYQNLIFR